MIKQKQNPPYYEERKGNIYKALLTQTGTNAPTVVEVANNGGEVVWTRTGIGQYVGTAAEIRWTMGKTAISVSPTVGGTILYGTMINDTVCTVQAETATDYTDNSMQLSLIEITVFE